MKNFKYIFLHLLIIVSFLSCNSDDSDNNEDSNQLDSSLAYEKSNIPYGTDSDQVFDLYLPANRTLETKTIILVHGGGWTSGDKSDMDDIVEIIQNQLPIYAIVNINYRLADQDNFAYPMQINDITSVVNYLKDNQSNYTISQNIGFIGGSAGAHLSMLWSYAFDVDDQVVMVCSIVVLTNFTDPAYLNNPIYQEIINAFGLDVTNEF